jgi:hypothetical protein
VSSEIQTGEIRCVGCGCTDSNPCIDLAGQTCSWSVVNEETGAGLCTVCAMKPLDQLIEQGLFW